MNYWGCLTAALKLHGFVSFSGAAAQGKAGPELQPTLSSLETLLVKEVQNPEWMAISEQLSQMLAGPVQTIALKTSGEFLCIVLGRVPPAPQGGRWIDQEHVYSEATGEWMKAIREHTAKFGASDDAKKVAEMAVTAGTVNPEIRGAVDLFLTMAQYHGKVKALTIDVFGRIEDAAAWQAADLTITTMGVSTQVWVWDLATGQIIRGGGGGGDAAGAFSMPDLQNPGVLQNTLSVLRPSFQ